MLVWTVSLLLRGYDSKCYCRFQVALEFLKLYFSLAKNGKELIYAFFEDGNSSATLVADQGLLEGQKVQEKLSELEKALYWWKCFESSL